MWRRGPLGSKTDLSARCESPLRWRGPVALSRRSRPVPADSVRSRSGGFVQVTLQGIDYLCSHERNQLDASSLFCIKRGQLQSTFSHREILSFVQG